MKKTQSKTDALSNNDLDKIAGLLDERIAPLATKVLLDERIAPLATKEFVEEQIGEVRADMKIMESNLKGYINEGIETVMGGLDDLSKQMAEKEKVERLIKWAKEASKRIGVVIDI